jgi:hypothetical protein
MAGFLRTANDSYQKTLEDFNARAAEARKGGKTPEVASGFDQATIEQAALGLALCKVAFKPHLAALETARLSPRLSEGASVVRATEMALKSGAAALSISDAATYLPGGKELRGEDVRKAVKAIASAVARSVLWTLTQAWRGLKALFRIMGWLWDKLPRKTQSTLILLGLLIAALALQYVLEYAVSPGWATFIEMVLGVILAVLLGGYEDELKNGGTVEAIELTVSPGVGVGLSPGLVDLTQGGYVQTAGQGGGWLPYLASPALLSETVRWFSRKAKARDKGLVEAGLVLQTPPIFPSSDLTLPANTMSAQSALIAPFVM